MKHAAHVALQCIIDHLVLLHAALAAKALGHDLGCLMVTVSGQVANRDFGLRNAFLDELFDVAGVHCHGKILFMRAGPMR